MGMKTSAAFSVAKNITKVVETDMLEENIRDVDTSCVQFSQFEIKTFLLYF